MKKDRLFLQYLLSYLCILLIPLVTVFIMIYGRTMDSMKENSLKDNRATLERIQSVVELQIDKINTTRDYLCTEVMVPGFSFTRNTLKAMEIQEELRAGIALSPFIYDIIYYQGESGYVIGSRSSGTVENYLKLMYNYEGEAAKDIIYRMSQITEKVCWPAKDVKPIWRNSTRLLTYILPIQSIGQEKSNYLIFFLPESSFTTLLQEAYIEGGLAYIQNEQGVILTSVGDGELLAQASLPEKQQKIQSMRAEAVLLDGTSYAVNCVEPSGFGWKFISLVPKTGLMQATRSLWHYIFITTILSVLIGGSFIFYFMKKNYIPIHNLREYTNKVVEMSQIGKNDVGTIRQVIQVLSAQNKGLQEIVKQQEGIYQIYFLKMILQGTDLTEEQIREKSKKANLVFERRNYLPVVFLLREPIGNKEEQIRALFEFVPKWMTEYLIFDDDNRMFTVLAGFDAGKEKHTIEYLKRILTTLNKEKNILCMAGVSKAKTSLKEVAYSYKKAVQAAQYGSITGYGSWVHFSEIKNRSETVYLESTRLQTAVLRKKGEDVAAILREMEERLYAPELTAESVKENCNEILYVLKKAFYMLDKKMGESGWQPVDCSTVPEFFERVAGQTALLLESAEQNVQKQDVFKEILLYIQENATSYELTVSGIADRFSMSVSYLSQYFKSHQGCNILDYITDLKIDAANEILTTTSIPIGQVAVQVGYSNEKSFMRRFKQITGMTPGEYRKAYSHEQRTEA